jgi:hypothetical protein
MFNIDVPLPEYIGTDKAARELLCLALRKVEEDPEDLIGFDTETHAKKLPVKGRALDWMSDTVTFWSLAFRLGDTDWPWPTCTTRTKETKASSHAPKTSADCR